MVKLDYIQSLNKLDEKQEAEIQELSQVAESITRIEELALSQEQYISALANNEIRSEKEYGNVKVIELKGGKLGVMNHGEFVVPFGKYAWIDGFDQGLARVRTRGKATYTKDIVCILSLDNDEIIKGQDNILASVQKDFEEHPEKYAKWGIIDENGVEVLPVEYDEVWNFYKKGRNSTKVIKNGKEQEFYFFTCSLY